MNWRDDSLWEALGRVSKGEEGWVYTEGTFRVGILNLGIGVYEDVFGAEREDKEYGESGRRIEG